jgi:hypothetical protein
MLKPLFAALAIAFALPLLGAATPAPLNYSLTCQIGKTNAVDLATNGSGSVVITINKSPTPASSGVQPGACAWQDRGMRPAEPSALCFTNAGIGGISLVNGAMTAYLPTASGPATILTTRALAGPTTLFIVSAHSGTMLGTPCFVVDQFGVQPS